MPTPGHPNRDEVLRETRWVAILIIPVLLAAFVILYFFPDSSGEYFAWPIKPRMSAMMLGATYFTGAIYFSVVARSKVWHQVRLGLLPVVLFASILGVATIMHWAKFSHDKPQFWLWVLLYSVLPFVLLWLWLSNERRVRPSGTVADEVFLNHRTRVLIGVIGSGLAVTSLALFAMPTAVIDYWPWKLSALTARITSAELGLFAFFMLEVALVGRWSEVRKLLFPQLVSPVVFVVSIAASWDNFDQSNPFTWGFVAFVLIVFLVGFPALYFPMEAERKRLARSNA